MMLQQKYPHLLPTSIIYGHHCSLPRNVTLLKVPNLANIGPIDLVVSRWSCQGLEHRHVWAKDFPVLSRVYYGNWFMLCNICNKHICTHVHICWRMSHHWGILGQLLWLDDNISRLGLASFGWLLWLVHEPINSNGCGLNDVISWAWAHEHDINFF
jgi:hypothetical protein